MARMTGGEAVVATLAAAGVDVVFGLPGVQIMAIYDAFFGRDDIRVVSVRHEQATAYMADGYARVTGRPGVALVVPGPGLQNASAAIGTAYAASSPVVMIAGQIDRPLIGRDLGALHEIDDQLEIVRPVTKWRGRAMTIEEIPSRIREALREARTGRPRPVVVDIPPDVLRGTGELSIDAMPSVTGASGSVAPDRDAVLRAVELLASATRPMIWAGGGVNVADASAELRELAERLGAPVATTSEGKGAIPETHPLALGVGIYGHGAPLAAVARADVVLAVGMRLTREMQSPLLPRPGQRLIHVDIDPTVIGRTFAADVAMAGDAKLALTMVLHALRERTTRSAWSPAELDAIRRDGAAWLRSVAPLQCEIIDQLNCVLPDDAVVVSDLTNVAYWGHYALRVSRPRSYVTSSYAGTLGFGFPTALGAKVGAPARPVVVLAGDGGFMYALGELATAVQYGINVIAVVFVDGAFGASRNDQRTRYHGREVGTALAGPSFAALAELFGALGLTAQPDRVDKALQTALDAGRPAIVEVPIPTLTPPFQVTPRADLP
jgi:acetolactate synthase I/II/III large subunit